VVVGRLPAIAPRRMKRAIKADSMTPACQRTLAAWSGCVSNGPRLSGQESVALSLRGEAMPPPNPELVVRERLFLVSR
jgi:hypothetical protein